MATPKKKPVGKPPGSTKIDLKTIDLERLRKLRSEGVTLQNIAIELGVKRDALRGYANQSPEISSALEKGQEDAIEDLVSVSYLEAKKPGNVAERLFWLKCRGGFREKQEIDHNHHFKPIVITKLDGSTIELSKQKATPQIEGSVDAEIVEPADE